MDYQRFFVVLALLTLTSFTFGQGATVHFVYVPINDNQPLTYDSCFASDPIPDGEPIYIYAGEGLVCTFAMNGQDLEMGAGYFFPPSYCNGPIGDDWWVEVVSSGCTYTSIQYTVVGGPQEIYIEQADWTCCEYIIEPPVIVHDPKGDGEPGSIMFVASVFGELTDWTVRLFYRFGESGEYSWVDMDLTGNPDEHAANISLWNGGTYTYYIKAWGICSPASTTPVYDFQLYPTCGEMLSYDNGSADRANWAGYAQFRWAVKFTPPATPYILCSSSFAVARAKPDSAHQRVRVEVYDSDGPSGMPGTVLFDDTTGSVGNVIGGLPPGQTYWATVQIRDVYNEPLVLYDDFYIA